MPNYKTRRTQILFLLLSVVSIGISIYLTVAHYEKAPVACSTTGIIDCQRVLSSSYSFVPFTDIPLSLAGLVWFFVSAIVAFLIWRVWPEKHTLRVAQVIFFASGVLTALYLIYVEFIVVRAICLWCTSLHLIMFVMLLIAIFQLVQSDLVDEEIEDEEPSNITESSDPRSFEKVTDRVHNVCE